MCSFMLICQCCFAIVKVLLKKVTYLLTQRSHWLFHGRVLRSGTKVSLLWDCACRTLCRLRYDRWPATDSLGDIWKHILEPRNHGALWRSIFCAIQILLLAYLLLTQRNFVADFLKAKCDFTRKTTVLHFQAPFWGEGLGTTNDFHLRLTGKRTVDFLLVLIELFC